MCDAVALVVKRLKKLPNPSNIPPSHMYKLDEVGNVGAVFVYWIIFLPWWNGDCGVISLAVDRDDHSAALAENERICAGIQAMVVIHSKR
mmetsp:Transcript_5320/g.13444  ORF Transcript_5320/g.13444 Transcript_5320/m.13444 type:complete len:90 (-) Transcript_5320:69-338(-)